MQEPGNGRDGLVLLVRTAIGSTELSTSDGEHLWLELGAAVIDALLASDEISAQTRTQLETIGRYFRAPMR